MPDRKVSYKIEIDAQAAEAGAARLREIFEKQLSNISVGTVGGNTAAGNNTAGGRQAAAAQAAAARIVLEEERQHTAIVRAEASVRTTLTRNEASVRRELARASSIAMIEEERRLTIAARSGAAERTAVLRQEAAARRSAASPAGTSAFMGMGQNLMYGALGALGVYSADQMARQAYDTGRQAAQMQRTAEVYDAMVQRVGTSSYAVRRAISQASAGTITDINAMTLANQLMAQKFAQSSTNFAGDVQLMTAASRKFSQVYPTAEGQVMSTQDVFARLIGFVREGNKELVDQFGISNQLIAQKLGIGIDGLASAEGATLRYKGVLAILRDELDRLGPATEGAAGAIEGLEARTANAADRAAAALIPITTYLAELKAKAAEGFGAVAGTNNLDVTRGIVSGETPSNFLVREPARKAFGGAMRSYDAALAVNETAASGYGRALNDLGTEIIRTSNLSEEGKNKLAELTRTLDMVARGQDSYTTALKVTTQAGIENSPAILAVVTRMGDAERAYATGILTAREYTTAINQLREALSKLAATEGFTAFPAQGEKYALGGLPWSTTTGQQYSGAALDQAGRNQWAEYNANQQATAYAAHMETPTEKAEREYRERMQQETAQKAQADFERAAEKASRAFEKAAEDSASSFKSKAEKVPGLLGTSDVTQADMDKAKAGLPVDYADSYLRRLRDVVEHGTSYEGVTVEDAAKRIGWQYGTDTPELRKAMVGEWDRQWGTGEAFRGGRNLDVIDWNAVNTSMNQQRDAASGQRSILAYLGMDPQRSTLDPAAQAALAKQLGIPEQLVGSIAGAAPTAATGNAAATAAMSSGGLEAVVTNLEGDVTAGAIGDRLLAVGRGLFAQIEKGFTGAADNATWGGSLIDSLVDAVAPGVMSYIESSLPPVP